LIQPNGRLRSINHCLHGKGKVARVFKFPEKKGKGEEERNYHYQEGRVVLVLLANHFFLKKDYKRVGNGEYSSAKGRQTKLVKRRSQVPVPDANGRLKGGWPVKEGGAAFILGEGDPSGSLGKAAEKGEGFATAKGKEAVEKKRSLATDETGEAPYR